MCSRCGFPRSEICTKHTSEIWGRYARPLPCARSWRFGDGCVVHLQVIAVGQLGVIARNGWYCLETEVSRWPALAGWRGLQLPEVQEHFEHTLHAQDEAWGGDEEGMLENFGLDPGIKIVYEGADEGPVLLKERMQQGKPTLFYFWTPSALLKQFNLSRVSLPEYNKAGFLAGLSDSPWMLSLRLRLGRSARMLPKSMISFHASLSTMMPKRKCWPISTTRSRT